MSFNKPDATSSQEIINNTLTTLIKVTFNSNLQYYHAGVKLASEFGQEIDTRAAVGNLSRNVAIYGAASNDDHKCNVFVASFLDFSVADPTQPAFREGAVNLSNVEISNCGQNESMRAGLRFERPSQLNYSNVKTSEVKNCVMRDSDTFGVYIKNA